MIIVDLFLITISLIFEIPNDVMLNIQQFDLIVCIILLGEYFLNLFLSGSKKLYIFDKENIIGLIASIPFDYILLLILPVALPVVFLRYLRIFKLIRVVKLAQFDIIKDLFRKTGLHKVLIGIFITILIFWAAFFLFSPSYGWVDDFYFVIVTLTTVGYGDVTPKTYNEKVLAIILILIGVFVFSAITALMSSFLTDRILDDDEEDRVSEIQETIEEKSENIMAEIKSVRMENKQLKDEANELKTEIKELKDMINKK
ncbi:ion channel [Methanobrevibacter smithii]|uniref:ion channel n=1 Tax=Methanobrevibacter smithii TaxID=2173 RepID=UPI00242D0BB4|nr:ion channel [Methanobrevibacter smithii]